MNSLKSAHSFLILLSCMLFICSRVAVAQEDQHLPPGRYQYLGSADGQPARAFTVDAAGIIHWDSENEQTVNGAAEKNKPKDEFESYDYPHIKWKGRRVYGTVKADAWLDTTYEHGFLKYVITVQFEKGLLKSNEGAAHTAQKHGLIVELLDQNGFKIGEFLIPGYQLHEVRSESLMEARSGVQFPEELYKRAQKIIIR